MKKLIVSLAGLAFASAAFAAVNPTRPMMTGRGNVSLSPAKVIVTNQTAPAVKPDETLTLEKFQVTGSLLRKPAPPAAKR